jgi:hypothetical protein
MEGGQCAKLAQQINMGTNEEAIDKNGKDCPLLKPHWAMKNAKG